jgi:cytochrome c1
VGPPLAGLGRRDRVAGRLPNDAESLARWIRSPQSVDPATAMPDMGVTEAHARQMAAYLGSLR